MSEATSPSAYAICPACSEQNKTGSAACARFGGPLQVVGGVVDPELRDFNRVQDALTKKESQRRKRILGGDFVGLFASFFRR
jgi:hypothetical protein